MGDIVALIRPWSNCRTMPSFLWSAPSALAENNERATNINADVVAAGHGAKAEKPMMLTNISG